MGSFSRLSVSIEQSLNLLERDPIHQGRVLSLVLDAFVGHDAGVVTVPQDVMQLVCGQWPLWAASSPALHQAPLFQGVGQRPQAVGARGIGLKRPRDMPRSYGVDLDPAFVLIPAIALDVEVSDRCQGWDKNK